MLRFPGGEFAGRRVAGFAMNQDILPTLLGLLGLQTPPVDGLDLMPLVRGEADRLRDRVITGWAGGTSGIMACARDREFAYSCRCVGKDPEEHLFDLESDPGETVNVAAARPDLVAAMRAALDEFLAGRSPGKARDAMSLTPPPCRVWVEKAPWAKRLARTS